MAKTKLEWAKYIAERGLRIVPLHHTKADGSCTCGRPTKPSNPDDRVKGVDYCGSPGKHPNVDAWQNVATSDPDLIEQWFASDPDMNYGCVAGEGNFILDIDVKDADGYETASRLLGVPTSKLDEVTFAVKTPSGGEHLYFDADRVYANSVKRALGEGLDVRSGNGFVVGPGSLLHIPEEFEPDNFVPVSYEVVNDEDFTALPDSIKSRMRESMERSSNAQSSEDPESIDSDENVYLAREYLKAREPAIEGKGGDEHTKSTSEGVRDFNISEELCYDLMVELFNDKCEPPWDPDELRKKVENGYKYAKRPMGTRRAMRSANFDDIGGATTVDDFPAGFFDTPEQAEERAKKDTNKKDKRDFVFYDGSAVLGLDKHYDFIISDWLPFKNYTIVLGGRGSGKTTIILDAVCHAASDVEWHKTPVDPGWYFIYIAGEDFEGVKDRYEAWCANHQDLCTFNPETERFELKDPSRIQFIDMAVDLMDEERVTAFGNAVIKLARSKLDKAGKPAKVAFIIDTWQRMTSGAVGGQSSDEAMQKALNNIEMLADKFAGPCIIAAHPPKANQNTMAGSGIIENRSDAIWSVEYKGAGMREVKVTRVKGAQEGNDKRLQFHNVEIRGFDRFNRKRKSVAATFQGGSLEADKSKVVSTTEEWQRSQAILELVRDMLARRGAYCPNISGPSTQVKLTEIAMDLYESDADLVSRNRLGDPEIRKSWIEKLKAIGFSEAEMKRTRDTGRTASKHPFYQAMDRLQSMFKGQAEIGNSGMGIIWDRKSRSVALSYGAVTKVTGIDKAEGLAANEQVDPETGEITDVGEVDEDFGAEDI